ncbi:MAG: polysaccharide biosynthesis protein PslG [Frankiaceae bacterium]|nr:polysaccharide biosynthesis protein PslG [Frankiaceae bacterium]
MSPGAVTSVTTATPEATGPQVRPEFFGLHIHSPASNWPAVAFGSTRLWDSGVTWKQLQPSRGTWSFSALDAQVAQANAAHKDIIMVLGVTPVWAAARPAETANYGAGSASEPKNLDDWTAYVRTLAERYRGKITQWELWNEPNAVLFWSGGPAAMVPLAKAAYGVLKATDPGNVVLSPGIIVRTENSPLWLDQYLAAGGGQYADVIAAHFYVKTGQRPEHLRPSIERIQAIMAARGVAGKPLWNTESSYGQVRSPAEIFAEPLASAYVARSMALFAGHGLQRVVWYAWDDHGFTGLYLTRPGGQPTEAGRVFGLMSTWLVGARGYGCTRIDSGKSEGAFACAFSRGDERFQILWHPGTTVQYAVPAGYRTLRKLDGSSAALTTSTVPVAPVPVLITTAGS